MNGSKAFSLNYDDIIKVSKGAALAGMGAAITYLAEWASGTDFGEWTPIVVAAAAVAVNLFRKWVADNS